MDEIVKLLWQRDEKALEKMSLEYGGFCRQLVSRFLCNHQDGEEALADVWFQIWNSIPPAKPKYFRAYLAKAVRNTALHYLEKNKAQKRSGVTVQLEELAECIPDLSMEREVELNFLKDVLNRFVRSLHGDERSFFVRRYYYGQSIREIAQGCKCTENRVAVTLHRVREKLRTLLEKEEYVV